MLLRSVTQHKDFGLQAETSVLLLVMITLMLTLQLQHLPQLECE